MSDSNSILDRPLAELVKQCPMVGDFLQVYHLEINGYSFQETIAKVNAEFWTDFSYNFV